jgi:hypothetical protein
MEQLPHAGLQGNQKITPEFPRGKGIYVHAAFLIVYSAVNQ